MLFYSSLPSLASMFFKSGSAQNSSPSLNNDKGAGTNWLVTVPSEKEEDSKTMEAAGCTQKQRQIKRSCSLNAGYKDRERYVRVDRVEAHINQSEPQKPGEIPAQE